MRDQTIVNANHLNIDAAAADALLQNQKIFKDIDRRLSERNLNHYRLTKILNINNGNWMNMKNGKTPLSLKLLCQVCEFLDLEIQLDIK